MLFPDGKTPAAGARVALYKPGSPTPVARGTATYEGHFSLVGDGLCSLNAMDGNSEMLEKPMLVAWVPGKHGARIAALQLPVPEGGARLVLPNSLTLRGKITIGGDAVSSTNGFVSVFAEYQGSDPFRGLCHLNCCADAEGNFELAGLTPGKYRVQAWRLDNIWLSASVPVTAVANDNIVPIKLDIGQPGCATMVTIVDKREQPLSGAEVTLFRPVGPLATQCWPRTLTADHAGVLYIPPLEVGEHKLRIADLDIDEMLSVPKLNVPHRPAIRRLTVDRRSD